MSGNKNSGRPSNAEIMQSGTSEQRQKLILSKLKKMSAEEIDALERIALSQIAALDDSPESFAAFYKVVHKRDIPEHGLKDWIVPLYEAKKESKGIVTNPSHWICTSVQGTPCVQGLMLSGMNPETSSRWNSAMSQPPSASGSA